jgi:hypothetical protein
VNPRSLHTIGLDFGRSELALLTNRLDVNDPLSCGGFVASMWIGAVRELLEVVEMVVWNITHGDSTALVTGDGMLFQTLMSMSSYNPQTLAFAGIVSCLARAPKSAEELEEECEIASAPLTCALHAFEVRTLFSSDSLFPSTHSSLLAGAGARSRERRRARSCVHVE